LATTSITAVASLSMLSYNMLMLSYRSLHFTGATGGEGLKEAEAEAGMLVVRGPNWSWGDQVLAHIRPSHFPLLLQLPSSSLLHSTPTHVRSLTTFTCPLACSPYPPHVACSAFPYAPQHIYALTCAAARRTAARGASGRWWGPPGAGGSTCAGSNRANRTAIAPGSTISSTWP
jgi:hypothetical protein